MADKTWGHFHDIAYAETFELRRPVLEYMRVKWRKTPDDKKLEFEYSLGMLSPHERDVVEFALNPYYTGKHIFSGLDVPACRLLAEAIYKLFGPGGALDQPEKK